MGHCIRQFIGEIESGYYGGTKVTISKEGMDAAEQDRKRRALMSDTYNLDCSRNPPSEPFKEPPLPTIDYAAARYERKPDNGDRNRRTDEKVSANVKHAHYFKDVSKLTEIDIYAVCQLFGVNDPSGATQHAVKKLLMSGQRGVKDAKRDLQEAADTLARKLQMMGGAA